MRPRGGFSDALLQLTGIFALTLSGPAYAMLQANAQFLVVHNLDLIDILAVTAALSPAPLAVAALFLLFARQLGERFLSGMFTFWAFAATALGAWQLLAIAHVTPEVRGVGAALGGAVFVALLFRSDTVARFTRGASLLGIAFPLIFLLDPNVTAAYSPTGGPAEQRLTASFAEDRERTPIILVIFDELPLSTLMAPDGRINHHRYPNFARLAETSTWFRKASTVASATDLAVPAILNGRYPTAAVPASAAAYPESLFSWLRGEYRMVVAGPSRQLCPDGACEQVGPSHETRIERWLSTAGDLRWLLLHRTAPSEWRAKLPSIDRIWRDIGRTSQASENRAVVEFQAFVDAVDNRDASFYFLHSRLPHAHWVYTASGKRHNARFLRGMENDRWGPSAWLTTQGFQRHIMQTRFADALLGRLLDRLEAAAVFDRALVIVTADHGVSFRPTRPLRRVHRENYADIIAVPLLIKLPAQRTGEVSDRWAETVDIVPTIADALKQPLTWETDGRSLLNADGPQRAKRTVFVNRSRKFTSLTFAPELSVDAAVSRKFALFGSGEDPRSIFRVGDREGLVGRRIESFPKRQSGFSAGVDNAALYNNVRLAGEVLPMWLEGHIRGASKAGPPLRLAIGLNGKIASVTQTFVDSAGRLAFQGFLPESDFLNGRNRVEIFAIEVDESGPRLARTTPMWPWMLETSAEGPHIVSADQRRMPVRRAEIAGVLGDIVRLKDETTFIGWAIDRTGRNRQVRVAVFLDGVADSAVQTDIRRVDVAKHFQLEGRDKIRSGFELKVPTASLKNRGVRLFAMTDDVAVEIEFPPEKLWGGGEAGEP